MSERTPEHKNLWSNTRSQSIANRKSHISIRFRESSLLVPVLACTNILLRQKKIMCNVQHAAHTPTHIFNQQPRVHNGTNQLLESYLSNQI